MTKIADPHDALPSFEMAVKQGLIFPKKCSLHPELVVLMDDANGDTRITYALIVRGKVKATVAYLLAEPLRGERCFQVGYAVAKPFRGKGIASDVLRKSIDEMRHGFKAHMKQFYIEAVVGIDNLASRRVAEKILTAEFDEIADKASGLPAVQYVRLISTQ